MNSIKYCVNSIFSHDFIFYFLKNNFIAVAGKKIRPYDNVDITSTVIDLHIFFKHPPYKQLALKALKVKQLLGLS